MAVNTNRIELLAGSNVTITEDLTAKTLTVASSGSGGGSSTADGLRLSASATAFKYLTGAATPTAASLSISATLQGALTGTPVFTVATGSAALIGVGGTSRTLAAVNMLTEVVAITATLGAYSDTITIVKVRDGIAGVDATAPAPELTPPPDASGVTVSAGFTQVIVQWAAAAYSTSIGHGHKRSNVYAVKKAATDPTLPVFSNSVVVANATSPLNIINLPSELNTRWHVWVKHETVDGIESAGIGTQAVNGATGTTGQDITQLMLVQANAIRETELHRTLSDPIRSIVRRADDAAEDALRAALATHESAKRAAAALLVEAQDRGTAIAETRTLVNTGDAQLASQITTLSAVVGSSVSAAQTEATARADADSAEALARTTLAAEVHHPTTGLAATLATLTTNYTTTAGMNSAISSSATSLTAAYGAADLAALSAADAAAAARDVTTLATANSFTYSRASIDGAISSSSATLTAAYRAADVAAISAADVAAGVRDAATLATANAFTYSRAGIDGAISTSSATLTAAYQSADAATLASADAAAAARDTSVLASANAFTYSRATITGAIAASASTLTAAYQAADTVAAAGAVTTANAYTNSYTYSTAGVNGAISGAITTYSATVNGQISAAVAVETSARTTYQGYASTLYTVRTTVTAAGRTLTGGFGLAGTTAGTAGPSIDFGVLANRFYVGAPNDGSAVGVGDIIPFTILTTNTMESGVLIPKGVYMDAAYIRNLQALYARISTLVAGDITAASIQVSQLMAGSIAVGSYIQSTGYTPGTSGFRISGDGLIRAFANSGARVLDMAATGTAPVLKVGTAFEVLADGTATYSGALNVKSAASGSRIEITGDTIKVFDGDNLRVKIGNLA